MVSWISEEQFETAIDAVSFDQSVQLVSGVVTALDKKHFEIQHQTIDESQFLHDAWRWYGVVNGKYFYLDLVVNDGRRVKPFSFNICSTFEPTECWRKVIELRPVFSAIGSTRIDHIASKETTPMFEVVRDSNDGGFSAAVIYRYSDKAEGIALCRYLKSQFSDRDLFIGERVT